MSDITATTKVGRAPEGSAQQKKESRRALASSFLGSTVEYYDFLLYGAAAGIVFPPLFFSELDPAMGTFLSYVILFTGYISRPIGGLLFGHFGDRFGRKNMLFITLMVMGFVSIGIGLLPTYGAIGVAAPLALVFLRITQGFAVGGEWAGATLMAMEHSTKKSRGFGASIAVTGGPTGAVLSTLMLGLFATLPDEQFFSWGWRVPFLLSAVIVLIGLYLRLRVTESPDFEEAKHHGFTERATPLKQMFTKYPKEVITGSLAGAAPLAVQALLMVIMVPYVVQASEGAITRDSALFMLTVSSVLHIFTIPFFAWVSDKVGRKPVMLAGALFSMIAIWPMFLMFSSGKPILVGMAFILGNPIIQASMYGPIGAFLSEKFETNARYTGSSLTFQMGSVLGAGLIPLVANRFLQSGDVYNTDGIWSVGIYLVILFAISGAAVALSKETHPRLAREEAKRG
ncbi:Sugar phosphate permease [Bowdeniella nasicola]|uniref:Sugar phosphate permease n=1 Tax=Bowdeniella nasicola TaxID=208480 RepID=A0A1H4CP13_9ACTO|nr:MFS transporter [Bowdeniella nasicola]SEA61842.1 Sugar phosphate permease [Bowdeniella nasicola]